MIWSLIDSSGTQAISLLSYLFIARLLSPSAIGVVAVAMIIVELFRTVLIESLAIAVQSLPNPSSRDYNGCFLLIVCASLVSALLVFGSSFAVGQLFPLQGLPLILRLLALVCACQGLSRTHEAWLSRNKVFRSLAIRSISAALSGSVVGIGLAECKFGPYAIVWQQITVNLASMVALWTMTPWQPTCEIEVSSLSRLMKFALPVSLTALIGFCNASLDVLFVTWFYGSRGAGFYSLAKRIVNSASVVIASAANRVFFSTIADTQGDRSEAGAHLVGFVQQTASITAPLFTAIAILSPALIHILFGPKWSASSALLTTMCITGFLTTIGTYNHSIMLVFGKPIWQTYLTALYAVSNAAIFMCVGRFSVEAIALGYVCRALVLYPFSIAGAARLTEFSTSAYSRAIVEPLVASAVMAGTFVLVDTRIAHESAWITCLIFVVSTPIAYDSVLYLFGRSIIQDVWSSQLRWRAKNS